MGTKWTEDKLKDARGSDSGSEKGSVVEFKWPLRRWAGALGRHMTFKPWKATECKLLSKILVGHGFTEAYGTGPIGCNLIWSSGNRPPPLDVFLALDPNQRVNRFPRSWELTARDKVYRNVQRAREALGPKSYRFVPESYVLPKDLKGLMAADRRKKGAWFVKPLDNRSEGTSKVLWDLKEVTKQRGVIVSRYILNPYLLVGHKCDLRVYIVVTSFDPLVVFRHREGVVRLVPVDYKNSKMKKECPNAFCQRMAKEYSDYEKKGDCDDGSHRWKLTAFMEILQEEGVDTEDVFDQIDDTIVKVLLAVSPAVAKACKSFVRHKWNCFELFGVDLLMDDERNPWFLGAKSNPPMGCDTPLDTRINSSVLVDALNLVGVPASDPLFPSMESLMKRPPSTPKSFVKLFPRSDNWSKYSKYFDLEVPPSHLSIGGDMMKKESLLTWQKLCKAYNSKKYTV